MSLQVIELGEKEPVSWHAVDIRAQPLVGKTDLFVRVKKADGAFLDWVDLTFKAAASAAQLDALLVQSDAVYDPGTYKLPGEFDTSIITGLTEYENLTFIFLQNPGTDAIIPTPMELQIRPTISQVLDELEVLKDGGSGNFDPNRDSLYHLSQNTLRVLGLLHENTIVDRQTYDEAGNLLTSRVRVFDSPTTLPSVPGGDEITGKRFEYSVTAGYSEGQLNEFKIERVI